MKLLKYKLFVIYILLVFYNSNVFGQEQLNIDYASFLESQIEEKYNTKNYYINDITGNQIKPESIYKLVISNKKEMCYFIDNINSFSNLEKLHLYKVKLKGFSFLKKLKKLRILSLAQNKKIDFDSLVNTLNKESNIKHLYITNKFLSDFPYQINQLVNLKSLGLRGTKIKEMDININLYYLDLSSNKKVDYTSVKIASSEVINLSDNEIKEFPSILGESKVLRGLIFSQVSIIKINCPIKGFDKLELLDVFGTNTNGVKKSCFMDAKKLEIIQQIR